MLKNAICVQKSNALASRALGCKNIRPRTHPGTVFIFSLQCFCWGFFVFLSCVIIRSLMMFLCVDARSLPEMHSSNMLLKMHHLNLPCPSLLPTFILPCHHIHVSFLLLLFCCHCSICSTVINRFFFLYCVHFEHIWVSFVYRKTLRIGLPQKSCQKCIIFDFNSQNNK